MTHLIKRFGRWGLTPEELWKVLLEHPLLLLNHPAEILHFKVKMFRQFKFTKEMGTKMPTEYPSALTW